MNAITKAITDLIEKNRVYSDLAIVKTIYTRSECNRLKIKYSPYKHAVCDVQLVKDGSMLTDVKLTPYLITDSTIVADASDEGSIKLSSNVTIDIPAIDSYVFISYLNATTAFVAVQSDADSTILGGSNGAKLSQYVKDDIRILELLNADLVKFMFPENKYFTLTSDTTKNTVTLDMLMSFIQIMTNDKAIITMGEDSDGIQTINLSVPSGGKISIRNADGISLVTILIDICTALEEYISNVNTAYAASAPIAPPLPPLIPVSVTSKLTDIKTRINNLLK